MAVLSLCNSACFKPADASGEKMVKVKEEDIGDAYATVTKSFFERIKGDEFNVFLLFFLYTLQGIPIGLASSLPLLMVEKGANFKDQTLLSLTSLPFSLKLLWAPLVDAVFVDSFGRRKTWLVPCQFTIGAMLIYLSYVIDDYLEADVPDLWTLTQLFFVLYFFTATQDIAVDGWALTLLSEENVGMGPTINSIGQTLGYFLAFTILFALNSADVCNRYLRIPFQMVESDDPLVTFSGFLYFWGVVFLICTLTLFIKSEKKSEDVGSFMSGYVELWELIKRADMRSLSFHILVHKVGFIVVDAVNGLKLIEYGVSKETLALLGTAMTPISFFLPIWIEKWCKAYGPADIFSRVVQVRTIIGALLLGGFFWLKDNKSFLQTSMALYVLGTIMFIMTVVSTAGFVAQMILFSQISDPKFGGTHMTLLNTIANLGFKLLSSAAMMSVDYFSERNCSVSYDDTGSTSCNEMETVKMCKDVEGLCQTTKDGFFSVSCGFLALGVTWVILGSPNLLKVGKKLILERKGDKSKEA